MSHWSTRVPDFDARQTALGSSYRNPGRELRMSTDEPLSESTLAVPGSPERQLDFRPGMDMRWEITRSTADTAGSCSRR
jgi:hypothetical protein